MEGMLGRLTPLDWGAAALYAAVLLLLGYRAARREPGARDFFLASRNSRWPLIGLSLAAANVSAVTLVGLPGAAYGGGISVFDYEWTAVPVLVLFSAVVLPVILRARVYTMPEFLACRYDGATRTYFTVLALVLSVVVDLSGSLYGGAMLFRLMAPGVPLAALVAILAAAAATYTAVGGLRGVLYTEAMQAAVLLVASVIVAVLAFDAAGGWRHVVVATAPERLSLIRPAGDPAMPWPAIVTGVPILGLYYWCTNQFIVQRVLSARTLDDGRWGSLFAAAVKLPGLFILVLPGAAALLLYPRLPAADLAWPRMLFGLMPPGLLGVVLTGFLAAIMSSSAATLNSAATIVTMDVVRRVRPGLGNVGLVRSGRIANLSIMAFAIAWTPRIEQFGSLFVYLQMMLAYLVPPVVVLFVGGILWPRASARGAHWAIVAGTITDLALFAAIRSGMLHLHFLYAAAAVFVAAAVALVAGSLAGPPPPPEQAARCQWRPALWHGETAALRRRRPWQNWRVQSLALLALTGWLVIAFR